MNGMASKGNAKEMSPDIKLNHCPVFVCREKEVKRAVLSRASNLWSYLLDKSIEASESRAECAGRVLEGLSLACCPPGPSWGVPACLFTIHLFRFSAPILLLLLAHTKKDTVHATSLDILEQRNPVTSCCTVYTMKCYKECNCTLA